MTDGGTVAPDNPIWVKFARAMAPMMALPAQLLAKLVDPAGDQQIKDPRYRRRTRSLRNRVCQK